MRRALALAFAALLAPLAFQMGACAKSGESDAGPGGGGIDLSTGGAGGIDPDAACALYEEQAVSKPVNLYVMFDKSSSMAGNKWDAAKAGLAAFLDDPKSAGVRVALNFFPRDPDQTPACDQMAYAEPEVPFDVLPDNAGPMKAALDAEQPDGFDTPMWPALGGAILKGIETAENNPGENSAVLLVTDGKPEGPAATCAGVDPEDPQEVANLAAAGLAFDPSVVTYIVGLPGVDQAAANLIAQAGGSDAAILVSNTNVEEEFRLALAKVRGEALPCIYELPPQVVSGDVGLGFVNVEISHAGGDPTTVPFDPDCSGDGWSYDDPEMPTAIVLCPETCAALKADLEAGIQVVMGCATFVE
jgi:von Willebrand factor type A domain-containing protein